VIKVRFQPSGQLVVGQPGQSLFELARAAGVPISTACVGKGTCGLCRVKIRRGEESLVPFNEVERKHLGNVYFLTKVRLSCQARLVAGDPAAAAGNWIEVEVPGAR